MSLLSLFLRSSLCPVVLVYLWDILSFFVCVQVVDGVSIPSIVLWWCTLWII